MKAAMLVMGLDTALQRCSVAILRDDVVLADETVGMERGHAEHLAPMAAAALEQAGVGVSDLDRVGVVVGPGGFTGVRVALSFARGLGVGMRANVVGVTSLAALAADAAAGAGDDLIAAVIDARRGQVYAALYDLHGECMLAPFVADPESARQQLQYAAAGKKFLAVGSGAPLIDPGASGGPEIDAKTVARLAAIAPAPSGPPAPLYLRPPDAKPGKAPVFQATARNPGSDA